MGQYESSHTKYQVQFLLMINQLGFGSADLCSLLFTALIKPSCPQVKTHSCRRYVCRLLRNVRIQHYNTDAVAKKSERANLYSVHLHDIYLILVYTFCTQLYRNNKFFFYKAICKAEARPLFQYNHHIHKYIYA